MFLFKDAKKSLILRTQILPICTVAYADQESFVTGSLIFLFVFLVDEGIEDQNITINGP